MKIVKSENKHYVNESLLGGAALSPSDIAMVEAQEIKWRLVSHSNDDLGLELIAS